MYVYGGWDGQKAHNSLFQLNLSTFEWAEVKAENPGRAPTEISGCGLVACGNRKLALFGGYGVIKEKKEKETKEKVDERYSLVAVEDEVVKPAEQPVENGGEELKSTDDETQQKVVDNGTNNKTEQNAKDSTKVEGSTKEDSETEQKLRDTGEEEKDNVNEAEEKSRENGDGENTKENSSLSGGDVTENGLVESVMAEIEERERAESIGGMEGGKDEGTKNKEGQGVDAGSEGGEDGKGEGEGEREKDRGSEGCGEDSGTVVHAEGEVKTTKDANVKIIDVVNEHVSDKSQKAVVIKLPAVSFRLPDENEATSETTETATGEREGGTSVGETGERVATETSTAESQPAELEQPADVEHTGGGEKEEEEEDIEECNTTISVYKRNQGDVKGWTNEVKVFDLDTSKCNIE